MTAINLEDFETRLTVRPLRVEDFEGLVEIQRLCFPGMGAWKREQIESQLRLFPEGQLCVELDGKVVASSSALIVDFAEYTDWADWKQISDNGYIRNHDPEGDTLYGIEIMVHPDFRGMRLSRRLYDARKALCRDRNIQRIIIGGRIPGYHRHAAEMSASDYVDAVMRKSFFDPVLTAQLANGFQLKRLIPDYMPGDKESCGYATFLEWPNVDFVPARQKRRYRLVRSVRLCVVQYQVRPVRDFDEFAQQCEFFIDVAADNHSDFVVFPELFTNQLLSCVEAGRPELAVRKVADLTPQYLEHLSEMALKYNVNIVGGSMFALEDTHLYNVGYLFRRDGSLERQKKLHVSQSERRWWGLEGGDRLQAFDTDGGKVAILLSNDIEVPELARIARAKGVDIVFVPYSVDERTSHLRVRTCALARAIENDVYVATAGCVGNLPFVDHVDVHYAQSGIYTPSDFPFPRDGVAVECPESVETCVFADVDLAALRRYRRVGASQSWAEAREDLYHVVYREDGEERRA